MPVSKTEVVEEGGGYPDFENVAQLTHVTPISFSAGGGVRFWARVVDINLKVLLESNLGGESNRIFTFGVLSEWKIHVMGQRRFDPFLLLGVGIRPVAIVNGVRGGFGLRVDLGAGMAYRITRHLYLSGQVAYAPVEMYNFSKKTGENWFGASKYSGYEIRAKGLRVGIAMVWHFGR